MTLADYQATPFRWDESWVDYIDLASPGAGAGQTYKVPGEFGVVVLAALATLTTSAAAANRLLALDFISANSVTRIRNPPPAVLAASQTNQRYIWSSAYTSSVSVTNGPMVAPVHDLPLPSGWLVSFTIDTVQAADQLAGLSLVVLKVPTGASVDT